MRRESPGAQPHGVALAVAVVVAAAAEKVDDDKDAESARTTQPVVAQVLPMPTSPSP
jgi:hypothetical protein